MSSTRSGTPSMVNRSSITSRVVPASGATIARSSPSSALSSDDLPALGGPTIASDSPSRTDPAALPVAPPARPAAPSTSATAAATARGAARAPRRGSRSRRPAPRAPPPARPGPFRPRRASRRPDWPGRPGPRRCDSAAISSATASAALRSSLPFRKARRVNSPGPAGRAPAWNSARRVSPATAGLPWTCSSTTSSPVALRGPSIASASPRSSTSPATSRISP